MLNKSMSHPGIAGVLNLLSSIDGRVGYQEKEKGWGGCNRDFVDMNDKISVYKCMYVVRWQNVRNTIRMYRSTTLSFISIGFKIHF